MLIHPYYPGIKFQKFLDLDERINNYYDKIYDTTVDFHLTPRYVLESGIKVGFRDIFYYIDSLYDDNTTSLVDVGCGQCTWKKWFPNIICFDQWEDRLSDKVNSPIDFQAVFNDEFSLTHTDNYYSGMALNSIHFINWQDIEHRIESAMNIVKNKFLFTFNFSVLSNVPDVSIEEQVELFFIKISKLNYNIDLFDSPALRGYADNMALQYSSINGTVRFILSKK